MIIDYMTDIISELKHPDRYTRTINILLTPIFTTQMAEYINDNNNIIDKIIEDHMNPFNTNKSYDSYILLTYACAVNTVQNYQNHDQQHPKLQELITTIICCEPKPGFYIDYLQEKECKLNTEHNQKILNHLFDNLTNSEPQKQKYHSKNIVRFCINNCHNNQELTSTFITKYNSLDNHETLEEQILKYGKDDFLTILDNHISDKYNIDISLNKSQHNPFLVSQNEKIEELITSLKQNYIELSTSTIEQSIQQNWQQKETNKHTGQGNNTINFY